MRFALLTASALCLAAGTAQAATTLFTDRAAFEAALSEVFIDTLDDLTVGSVSTLVRDDFTLTGDVFKCVELSSCGNNGGIGFNHPAYLWNYAPQTLTFNTAINGFGLDFGNNAPGSLTLTLDGNQSAALSSGSSAFFGLISDTTFTEIAYSMSQTEFALTDNFTYGTLATSAEVPLPASLWSMLAALAFGFGLRRRVR
ncbi:VPLPA-CTERM sorting domain-containing protein [Pacificoceanicola onchidii]|uniref:VPLPA-CTERM sorting domain-containing protein n=1 Tax=Pacificoceanicola onchidii TaxID=2562685 RepID=UPI0010A5E98F|nr:VPLPA-CTERM sorting domain-containing protein [Pacificoceanicola onchidii]